MTIAVVTDSSSCLTHHPGAHHLHIVPLHVVEIDGVRTTSGANPQQMSAVYKEVMNRPGITGIISLHLSAKISGTYAAAVSAASQYNGCIRVVDSQTSGLAMGHPAIAAAFAGENSDDLDAIEQLVRELLTSGTTWVYVPKLDALRASGRISAARALLGTALAIKPVMVMQEGELSLIQRARTTTKALLGLQELVHSRIHDDDRPIHIPVIGLHHHCNPEAIASLIAGLRAEFGPNTRIDVVDLDDALALHLGEGAVVVSVIVCADDTECTSQMFSTLSS